MTASQPVPEHPSWRRPSRHRGAASDADDALLADPLTTAETDALADWLKRRTTDGNLSADELVDGQRVKVFMAGWESLLHRWVPDLPVTDNTLTRADVFAIAQDADGWVPLLVTSYAWGQGSNGYGPYRMSQVLSAAGGPVVLERVLGQAVDVLTGEGSQAAYQRLRGAIVGLGPAFYTKWLYFVGHAHPPSAGPRPLILDQRVAEAIRAVATERSTRAGLDEPAALARWQWSQGSWTEHRYGVYLEWADRATSHLVAAVAGWAPRGDLLELALFDGALGGP